MDFSFARDIPGMERPKIERGAARDEQCQIADLLRHVTANLG
jgi:hypothetical protein